MNMARRPSNRHSSGMTPPLDRCAERSTWRPARQDRRSARWARALRAARRPLRAARRRYPRAVTWLDLLGWAGSALLIYSLMQARVLRFRVLNLIACLVLVVFNAVLGIWPMV